MTKVTYTPEQMHVLRKLQAKFNLLERYIVIALDRAGTNNAADFADAMSFINISAENIADITEKAYNNNLNK